MKTKKRGFTIVELVIVIAVIAILAAVLVPTFTGVIASSKASAALQEARAAWMDYVAVEAVDANGALPTADGVIKYTKDGTDYYFEVEGATFVGKTDAATTTVGEVNYTLTISEGTSSIVATTVQGG